MELIKEIESRRDIKGNLVKWGSFWCDDCKIVVERRLQDGLKQKFCGYNIYGRSYTRLYNIWIGIKTRCLNPNFKQYKDYGGRGITICPEWVNDYTKFRDWSLSNGYADNLEIDRIDNNGNYEPSNCRWITQKENRQKKRNVILTLEQANEIRELDATGKYTKKELAHKFGVDESTISYIVNNKIWVG